MQNNLNPSLDPRLPLVSILCATKNEPRLLRAIQSILDTTIASDDIEILIKEGGEVNSEARDLVRQSGHKYEYICCPDLGPYDAMNTLIRRASGSYTIILNSDDILISKNLVKIARMLREFSPDVLFSDVLIMDSGSNLCSFSKRPLQVFARWLNPIIAMPVPHGGFICKTSILKEHFFDLSAGLEADYCQMLEILNLPNLIIYDASNIPVSVFSLGGLSSSRDFFSARNPHFREIVAISKTTLGLPTKLIGVFIRLMKIIALIPVKLIASLLT